MESLMAIVPVKPPEEAKSRLMGVLAPEERVALVRRLLDRTLLKLTRARGIARVAVISRDASALGLGRKYGAWSIPESNSGLNDALEQARRVCVANGARALLIVPADLPKLRVRDVERIIALGQDAPCVVAAPAARDGGTNALLLNPADAIAFQFGQDSFDRHVAAARARQIPVVVYDSEHIKYDLDLPQDLDAHSKSSGSKSR
jgi:2-phospho-L-lactate guanylyltransferase